MSRPSAAASASSTERRPDRCHDRNRATLLWRSARRAAASTLPVDLRWLQSVGIFQKLFHFASQLGDGIAQRRNFTFVGHDRLLRHAFVYWAFFQEVRRVFSSVRAAVVSARLCCQPSKDLDTSVTAPPTYRSGCLEGRGPLRRTARRFPVQRVFQ